MRVLAELVKAVEARRAPELVESKTMQIRQTYKDFQNFIAANPDAAIYGATTLPGHRDGETTTVAIASRWQENLIENHALPCAAFYPSEANGFIAMAKLYQIAAGGSLISGELYKALIRFTPELEGSIIPKDASYSSGDVIPGAHFAQAALKSIRKSKPTFALKAGEGIALINGSFVHIGLSAYALFELRSTWSLLLENMHADASVADVPNPTFLHRENDGSQNIESIVAYVSELASDQIKERQLPVSFRAIPQVIEALATSFHAYARHLDANIFRPSNNPLFVKQMGTERSSLLPHSQASFMVPSLSIATTGLIEALLLALWSDVERTKFLLSGNIEGVALDGQTEADPLGFIQWPKLMQALLEQIRLELSRLAFASGSDTSYGTEDLWSLGVGNVERLLSCQGKMNQLLSLGLTVRAKLSLQHRRESGLDARVLEIAKNTDSHATTPKIRELFESKGRFNSDQFYVI